MAKSIEERVVESRSSRPIYVYEIPAKVGVATKSVGLVELTSREEQLAAKASTGDGATRLAVELAKMSLVQVDGKTVGPTDGSVDKAWDTLGPKVRNLILTAYVQIHHVEDEEVTGFLASRQVRV